MRASKNILSLIGMIICLAAPSAAQTIFSNTAPITIPVVGTASPYPSNIAVSGLSGTTTKVTVTLSGFNHTFSSDVGVLLVSPSGASVNLMSRCSSGFSSVSNANLTFDDAAASGLPNPITSGTYRPTQCGVSTYSAPAPAAPYGTTLSAANGANPNGTWQLYVQDFSSPSSGSISGGWSLTITTSTDPLNALRFNSANFAGNEGASATITVTRNSGSPGSVTVDYAASNGTATGGAACSAGIDFINTSGTLTFTAGVNSQTFTVQLCSDAVIDPNETVNLALSNPQGGATLGTPNTAVLTIIDTTPAVQFSAASYSVIENNGSVRLIVTRTGSASGTTTVDYATTNGTATGGAACAAGVDYITKSGTLTFGSNATIQNIFITICDNAIQDGNRNFTVTLSNPSSGSALGSPNPATITIQDDDLPPTFLTVNSTDDVNDGVCDAAHCSLREAIAAAAVNNTTVNFSPLFNSPQTISLTAGELLINKNLIIAGTGASLLTVQRSTLAATPNFRIFHIASGNLNVTISGLTVSNGKLDSGASDFNDDGGGILNDSTGSVTISNSTISNNSVIRSFLNTGNGGGIYKSDAGILTINNSAISGNSASNRGSGAGIYNNSSTGTVNINGSQISGNDASTGFTGGIDNVGIANITNSTISANQGADAAIHNYPTGALTIIGSTISGNTTFTNSFATGGGIRSTGAATITNSTISGNTVSAISTASGGGIYISGAGTLTITGSTISGNSASTATTASSGGGIYNTSSSAVNIKNTIVAGNTIPSGNMGFSNGPDVFGTIVSQGYNLIGKSDGSTGFTNGANNDQVGTVAAPIDPLLAPLGNNGGSTRTHALLSGSPAIDKGNSFGLTTDQRGMMRPIDNPAIPNAPPLTGDGADIGAFEVQVPTAASVSVGGRVTTATGRGITNVRLSLTDSNGNVRTVTTSAFGYYRFDDVTAGETYILNVRAKHYSFSQPLQVLSVNDETTNVNFIAFPN